MGQRDIVVWEGAHQRIGAIFIGEEFRRRMAAGDIGLIHEADIAAGTESPCPRAADRHCLDVVIRGPILERLGQPQAHAMGQGVQRLGPVQGDQPQRASLFQQDMGLLLHGSAIP